MIISIGLDKEYRLIYNAPIVKSKIQVRFKFDAGIFKKAYSVQEAGIFARDQFASLKKRNLHVPVISFRL
ncbi:hypothetical protein A3D80_00490 [Candidatus Roizmanbacteria bacterium RIFCSPHIGHO2_02_FULL_40_13b]|uniref:Uncharacterized protein n=1 Tax=Candidatus Roizmanbacteria bacterium RIFCSPHIGHO2_01_FULL_39_24 TaxID=1802032 RepID=A0A1F7GL15_9BACT|nr:MAG: hypothetical protein A2799_02455 [Candidatus Roizmanbacteria bacterium RIFCSPHIGHO2_01_FULL_39_24]OGK27425.1 MAG: hypothetical protein A3D80_00490 [Candidatus Roizmanbacteria bacterium RIFCSPHIGHO2_02_FULL_40_13b]OGK50430.1 MAG: hypothetical protein A3A56_02260 [Candidatus Roizmanbacteria bacterium RIFCSPLOWO2_01_FULL_40_32]OGK56973.1 MAG: hypothetical protein A3H83_00350 [Candidatus Roizmanbacteria bacterium RIFCSPLOWO2_02_FULL_39_8]